MGEVATMKKKIHAPMANNLELSAKESEYHGKGSFLIFITWHKKRLSESGEPFVKLIRS